MQPCTDSKTKKIGVNEGNTVDDLKYTDCVDAPCTLFWSTVRTSCVGGSYSAISSVLVCAQGFSPLASGSSYSGGYRIRVISHTTY